MKKLIKTFTTNNYLIFTLGIVFVFILWVIISFSIGEGNLYFPTPFETFKKLGELLSSEFIYKSIGMTFLRTIIGFGISFACAAFFGILAGNISWLYVFFKPLVTILKSIPTAALVFLFLVNHGSDNAPIYIVFLLSFPIIYESFVGGIRSVSDEINDSLKVDGGGRIKAIL